MSLPVPVEADVKCWPVPGGESVVGYVVVRVCGSFQTVSAPFGTDFPGQLSIIELTQLR